MAKWNSYLLLVVMATVNINALTGRILDKLDMAPVPAALVTVMGTALSAETDNDGMFSLIALHVNSRGEIAARPVYSKNSLIIPLEADNFIQIEIFDLQGNREYSITIPPGSHYQANEPVYLKQGVYTVTWHIGSESGSLIMLHMTSNKPINLISKNYEHQVSKNTLSKKAVGKVLISKEGLVEKEVSYETGNEALGDIILDYPPRQLGVGAKPIYGSVVLFDGVGTKNETQAEFDKYWGPFSFVDGKDGDQSGVTFKLLPDPSFPSDNNHWTLQTCCHRNFGYDDLQSTEKHADVQIHAEFNLLGEYDDDNNPDANIGDDRAPRKSGYNNSGVHVQSRYELQILSVSPGKPVTDNHNMASIVNKEAASSNEDKPNGQWQAYDITFKTSKWSGDVQTENAIMSAWWNGKLIHKNLSMDSQTSGSNHSGEIVDSKIYGVKLQCEGTDVRYRNIWIRHLKIEGSDTDIGY